MTKKFTYKSMLWELDNYMADYGNQEMDFGDDLYDEENECYPSIDELSEDEAEYVFFLNNGDEEVCSATMQVEENYGDECLTEEYKYLSKEEQEEIDKELINLAKKLGIDEI